MRTLQASITTVVLERFFTRALLLFCLRFFSPKLPPPHCERENCAGRSSGGRVAAAYSRSCDFTSEGGRFLSQIRTLVFSRAGPRDVRPDALVEGFSTEKWCVYLPVQFNVTQPTSVTSCFFPSAFLSASACSLARSACLALAASSAFLLSSSCSLLAASSEALASAMARSRSFEGGGGDEAVRNQFANR